MTEEQRQILETLKATSPDAIRTMSDEEFAEFRRRNKIPNYLPEYIAECVASMQSCVDEFDGEDLLFLCHVEVA